MKTANKPAEILKRIEGLEAKKEAELTAITHKIQESNAALTKAKAEIKSATESTDLTAYTNAKAAAAEASNAIEMYTARYAMIERREYVTTKDSNATIDAILQYEADIADEYIKEIGPAVDTLKKAHADYMAAVKAAENTIAQWTSRIHANYRSETTTYADGSNVSKTPVPVRNTPYFGCKESAIVAGFLDKISDKIKSEKE